MHHWIPHCIKLTWRLPSHSSGAIRACRVRSRQQSTSSCISYQQNNQIYRIKDEVQDALANKKPVVALETTIYTHGLPYPDNVALAYRLEDIVREHGAVPATVGVVDGIARVGLSKHELTRVAEAAGKPDTLKVSRRDLPYILGLVCKFLLLVITIAGVYVHLA